MNVFEPGSLDEIERRHYVAMSQAERIAELEAQIAALELERDQKQQTFQAVQDAYEDQIATLHATITRLDTAPPYAVVPGRDADAEEESA